PCLILMHDPIRGYQAAEQLFVVIRRRLQARRSFEEIGFSQLKVELFALQSSVDCNVHGYGVRSREVVRATAHSVSLAAETQVGPAGEAYVGFGWRWYGP